MTNNRIWHHRCRKDFNYLHRLKSDVCPFCGDYAPWHPKFTPVITSDQKRDLRPNRDTYFLRMARLVSTRATCLRRSVGCILVNARGHVLATGYNGNAAGMPHCNDSTRFNVAWDRFEDSNLYPHACPGAESPSGTNLDGCQAIHAEQNALLQCRDVFEIDTCYCTTAPCMTCTKLLMNTSCKRILFIEDYPHAEEARKLWQSKVGQVWFKGTL